MARKRNTKPAASSSQPPTSMPRSHPDPRLNKGASTRAQWMVYAIASGACAAFNGVFAKLTTTKLTSTLSESIASALHLSEYEGILEVVIRGLFFILNLTFNGVMWGLFTKALAKGTSTTQVSIMNTSTNFFITAILGFAIFSEALPPVWWLGAAFLVAGNVIIGRKDEDTGSGGETEREPLALEPEEAGNIADEYEDHPAGHDDDGRRQ